MQLEELIARTGLSRAAFSGRCGVSEETIKKAINGNAIRPSLAWKICNTIKDLLQEEITPESAGIQTL